MGRGIFSLGVTLPLVFSCALLLLAWRWPAVQGWLDGTRHRRHAWCLGWGALFLWMASVAVFWAQLANASTADEGAGRAPAVAIVVLGSGTPGGKVSPVLAARLDRAYERAHSIAGAAVVVSGGIDFRETRSEGAIMGEYLRAKGLAPERIIQEEKSTSTEQNLRFSRALLAQRGLRVEAAPVEVVTSDFHTLRAKRIARRAGYGDVRAVGAPTPLYVRYNAWLREYFAVVSGFVLREF